ncbi:uncharacterized protein BO87DRAFT_46440 [Aspergillus neoniger CBS 115656]|uniref:Uncharacterized protein n=1 Tax=Aspergillus neoniger (strain CBS 115656) TaxID=1448310 RepID=A0A318YKP0_ASPNB|nr:hypothetical protein BO87DRAFT_46440 [Aspergillus neoniger CBS 115656]PYH34959.1 hypothetical protein BO87DRAFT_46440 [Aspergillus neoniger CBS 115656]
MALNFQHLPPTSCICAQRNGSTSIGTLSDFRALQSGGDTAADTSPRRLMNLPCYFSFPLLAQIEMSFCMSVRVIALLLVTKKPGYLRETSPTLISPLNSGIQTVIALGIILRHNWTLRH